jgi:mRNA interferase MazF
MVQGVGSIPTVRLQRKIGVLPKEALARIKVALAYALDLEAEPQ